MKRRLREGAKLIVADPRRIDLVRTPHVEAAHHLPAAPGTNVAFINALAHVIVTEGLVDEAFVAERCEDAEPYLAFIAHPSTRPRRRRSHRRARRIRPARRRPAVCRRAQLRDLLRPGRHRAQPGLDDGDGHGQPRDGHRQPRAARVWA
jgi:anaerobic selenocysteine-containing dehydrogenase